MVQFITPFLRVPAWIVTQSSSQTVVGASCIKWSLENVVVPAVKNDFESSSVLIHSTSGSVSDSVSSSRESLNIVHDPNFDTFSDFSSQSFVRTVVSPAKDVVFRRRLFTKKKVKLKLLT